MTYAENQDYIARIRAEIARREIVRRNQPNGLLRDDNECSIALAFARIAEAVK